MTDDIREPLEQSDKAFLMHDQDNSDQRKSDQLSIEERFSIYYDRLASGTRFQVFAYLAIALGINATGFYFYLLGFLV